MKEGRTMLVRCPDCGMLVPEPKSVNGLLFCPRCGGTLPPAPQGVKDLTPPPPPAAAPPMSGNGEVPARRELSPELLEWARRQFSDEEILAGLRELHNGGGQELADFIGEL